MRESVVDRVGALLDHCFFTIGAEPLAPEHHAFAFHAAIACRHRAGALAQAVTHPVNAG